MSKIKEREAFNFKGLLKSFFGNGVANIEDEVVEQEVKEIIAQQDNKFIEQLVKSAESTGNGSKRISRLDLRAAPTKQAQSNSVEDRNKEEERERE